METKNLVDEGYAHERRLELVRIHREESAIYREAGYSDDEMDALFASDWDELESELDIESWVESVPDMDEYLQDVTEDEEWSEEAGFGAKEFLDTLSDKSLIYAFSFLSDTDIDIVRLVYFEGLSTEEVKRVHPSATPERLARIKAELALRVKHFLEEEGS
ncbi:MAG: hypothetical protein LUD29_06060 [Clostridia bacterium]|nr:hypothetical protein [Clostridia bacterium]